MWARLEAAGARTPLRLSRLILSCSLQIAAPDTRDRGVSQKKTFNVALMHRGFSKVDLARANLIC